MSTFQIVQMDPDAAKWLGFAKQQCKRIMDNGTKDFYREWPLGDATVKAKSYGGTVKLWLVAGGVVDFVGVAMPNPVPYRGVSIGVVDRGVPYFTNPNTQTQSTVDGIVYVRTNIQYSIFNSAGVLQTTFTGYSIQGYSGGYVVYLEWSNVLTNRPNDSASNWYEVYLASPAVQWPLFSGTSAGATAPITGYSYSAVSPSYESLLAADLAADTGGKKTYVMASDGTVLASEVQITTTSPSHTYYVPDTTWNGDAYCNMYVDYVTPPINHQLTFTVPEDCVFPAPATPPDVFKARRKAWFKKNSDEFIAALKGKFQPGAAGVTRAELQTGTIPARWDYWIKNFIGSNYSSFNLADGSKAGRHTVMPIIMSITSAADEVLSDTSAGLSQAGTMVTKRTTTFAYTDADGKAWSVAIDGTLTQVVTEHRSGTPYYVWAVSATYLNWYSTTVPSQSSSFGVYMRQQFRRDWEPYQSASMGVWNGLEIYCLYGVTQFTDSAWVTAPTNPLTWTIYNPPIPAYSNTLSSTAPDILLQYHNTVIPTYVANTAQSSTVMNNSAMYHVKQVKLRLFAPAPGGVSVGLFADPTDADGATQIAYYGEAALSFDWATGAITVSKWSPKQDDNGNDAPTIINLPTGYSYKNVSGTLYFNNGTTNYTQAYNCAIGYVWGSQGTMWPDVAEYWKAKNTKLKAGTFDQVLYTVMQGKQITPPP